MDFLDLDTSLKVTEQNVTLYASWMFLNKANLSTLSPDKRSAFIKDNIGFVESNPGAIISFLKKSGLATASLQTSQMSEKIAKKVINYNEYCLIHLSKSSLFLNGEPKANLLLTICKYISSLNASSLSIEDVRKLDESLNPIENDRNTNKRTDYVGTCLVGTGLFKYIGNKDDGKLEVVQDAESIITYIASLSLRNLEAKLNSNERFDVFANFEGGIIDLLDTNLPLKWNHFFHNLPIPTSPKSTNNNHPLQQIFYGAPGTGKSFKIDEITKTESVIRTTFHPDSDYSTFVGCYKPAMASRERIHSQGELISKLTEIKKSGVTYPVHKFSATYWESLNKLSNDEIKAILTACGFTDSMNVEVGKGMAIGQEFANHSERQTITYEYVPQAFIQAYIKAWKFYQENPENPKKQYLIIEEINRGNCAQIFGDLFQLLDRNNHDLSSYSIVPDKDLQKHIADYGLKVTGILNNAETEDISDKINSGEILCLPSNLYIWATMNTSDQSLFPIDSAFKRRWDWEYMPIKRADNEPENKWIIKVTHGDKTYWCYWWEFLEAINHQIEETTHSEDKQLGYFFAKPKAGENFISIDTFVNKVIFYLWNDVFKEEDSAVFQYDNDKIEDVSINRSGTMYFRHFMENKDEMIHYFINQLFAMGKDNSPVVPIDYLKNDADSKVIEHLPKMREDCEVTPMPQN